MKKIAFILIILSLQSCIYLGGGGDTEPEPTSKYTPVFMDRTVFENSVILQNNNTIGNAGKIYIFNGSLFINEKNNGFHVFDNSDPTTPTPIKYINAPGATDMAIKDNTIYINQARDLIAVELSSNMQSLTVTKRIKNIFPPMLSPDGFNEYTPDGKVLVNWILN